MAEPSPRAKQPTPPPTGPKLVDYTPDPLDEPGRPELAALPRFVAFGVVDGGGENPTATSFYAPDWDSLEIDAAKIQMTYRNIWGEFAWVTIEFDRAKRTWCGTKIVRGLPAGSARAGSWRSFFKHLSILGLTNGEPCWFHGEPV